MHRDGIWSRVHIEDGAIAMVAGRLCGQTASAMPVAGKIRRLRINWSSAVSLPMGG
jgi:hypothetical protein